MDSVEVPFSINDSIIKCQVPAHLVPTIYADEDFRLKYLEERGLITLDNSEVSNNLMVQKSFNWNSENTKLLISLFDHEKENYRNPKQKKKCVWERIAAEMEHCGHKVSADECDKKFRNLKVRYKTIKDKMKSTGECRRHWEFFKSMDDALLEDATINSQIKLLASFPENDGQGQDKPRNVEENATLTVAPSHSNVCNTEDLHNPEDADAEAGSSRQIKQRKQLQIKTKNRELQQFRIGLLNVEKQKVEKLDTIAKAYLRIAGALEERNKLISSLQKSKEE